MRAIARFAWGVLAYDIAVVAWGAYVRATGSGAGCGRHWPMCNGVILPRAPRIETIVELSHRVSSAGAFALTVALLVWAMNAFPRGHRVRWGAAASVALMGAEALIGAGLVLFEYVAHDASLKRALSMCLHLGNTFLLLGATALTAWWASGGGAVRLRGQRGVVAALAIPLAALLVVGASGAVTALGDTLFPSASLAAGWAQDFSADAHLFVRLRAIHPLLAGATAVMVLISSGWIRVLRPSRAVLALSRGATVLVLAQIAAGFVDVATSAAIPMQLVHVVLADLVWIVLVLTSAAALTENESYDPSYSHRASHVS